MFAFIRRQKPAVPMEEKGAPLTAFDLFSPVTASGFAGGAEHALQCPAVAAATRLISESAALCSPCVCLKDHKDDPAQVHPLQKVLDRPAPWVSGIELIKQVTVDLVLYGNCFVRVVKVRGKPRELHRLDPRATAIEIDLTNGEPSYRTSLPDGSSAIYTFREVAHVRSISVDGCRGLGVLHLGREAIGAALTMEAHAAGLFARGARPSGILEVSGRLTTEMIERLRASFSSVYGGSQNAGRTAILESGMKFAPMTMTSTDSQFIENRRYQVAEIGRLFNLPPILLGDLQSATFDNVEQLQGQFLNQTLTPILETFEAVFTRVILSDADQEAGYVVEFDSDNFMRADMASRFAAYKSGIESGILTTNEARDYEGLPPVEGGDTPMRSVQVMPINAPMAAQSDNTVTNNGN
jgi:HK97 family phage portal protein